MDELDRYLEYARNHPEQFINPHDGLTTILLDPEEIAEAEALTEQRLLATGVSRKDARSWSRVGIVFHDPYNFLLRDAVRFGDGSVGAYDRFVDPDGGAPGVIIFPMYRGNVVLVRHFRHATRRWSLEIPRGFGEKGLSNEKNALREVQEEIGAEIERMIPLGMAEPNNGMSAESDAFFFAELRSVGAPEVAEGISSLHFTPVAEFERLIGEGIIVDGFTLCAYAQARTRGLI